MNPVPSSPPVVLVTGAPRRLGREIALALAAGGWQVAVHYRDSEAEAMATVADCARLAGASAAFQADLGDEAAVRGLLPAVAARMGRVDAVVNNASTFEQDSAASFGFAALDKHLHTNTGAAVLLAQALHAHIAARGGEGAQNAEGAQGAVVNLLDQKLWNQNPDFGRRGARPHADQPFAERRAVRGQAQAVAAGPLFHARRRRGRGQIRAGKPLYHRYHAAGGRRPAPDEVRT
jgi:NAD(P)-dependent dehydrogenase (short-subunit alcohol dehydrogenase family)